jgi:hypothetical protein
MRRAREKWLVCRDLEIEGCGGWWRNRERRSEGRDEVSNVTSVGGTLVPVSF